MVILIICQHEQFKVQLVLTLMFKFVVVAMLKACFSRAGIENPKKRKKKKKKKIHD